MFYHLLYPLNEFWGPLRIFRYITVRTAGAMAIALLVTWILGPWIIERLRRLKVTHSRGEEKMDFHLHKLGTPTMGGLIILAAIGIAMALCGNFSNRFVWLVLLGTFALGLLGFADDYLKMIKKNAAGLASRYKLIGQILIGLAVGTYLYFFPIETAIVWKGAEATTTAFGTSLQFPFLKEFLPPLGLIFIPFVLVVLVGSSNAVNLTDGLDGLAIGCVTICAMAYAGLAYVSGHWNISSYLNVLFVADAGEITVFLGAVVGAALGFLWYNGHPAEIFMGDTGSLALGGAIGLSAICIKQELLLVLVGGIFVAEAASVIIQVASFRLTGKRVFRCSPLHHHFELLGWPESKVVTRFWIVAILLGFLTFATLKLR